MWLTAAAAFLAYTVVCMCMSVLITMRTNLAILIIYDMLRYIHRNKTGALIRASVRAGAVIGGASDNELEAFTDYAEKIGLVFQIVDDILDVVGDEDITGKKTGMDAELGKLTYPAVFGLEKSYEFAAIETQAAVDALKNGSQVSSDFLEKLALDLQNRIS